MKLEKSLNKREKQCLCNLRLWSKNLSMTNPHCTLKIH